MDEYVGMLVAAGWITAGDIDDEYQTYLKCGPQYQHDDDASYEQWQGMRRQLQELNAEYVALDKAHPDMWDVWNHQQRKEGERLLREMALIECHLRY